MLIIRASGTFARVWLATLKGGPKEGQSQKVFALKILRKVDSTIYMLDRYKQS